MDDTPLIDPRFKELFSQVSTHLKSRLKLIVFLFLFGLVAGIPLAKELVENLLNSDILPAGVNVIVLTPVEFIMIQVRVGAWLGSGLAITALLVELAWKSELNQHVPKPGRTLFLSIIAILFLAISGLIYSWELLTPMLLQYLSEDAQSAGLSTEWRLSSFVGFILNLCLASAIGFQAPLVTILAIRSGAVERDLLVQYRRHIWFTTFVLGAAFSPPDPLSLFLVAIPIILLFELALLFDAITGKKPDARI